MRRNIGVAIGQQLSPVVEGMDLNSIIHQIDLEDLLVNHVDLNRVLATIDIDEALSRVDLDSLLLRVDIDGLLERSNLEAIISRSSLGFCTSCMNTLRSKLAYLDQSIQRCGRLSCCSKEPWLPPIPGRSPDSRSAREPWPKQSSGGAFGKAIQYRCCGTLTRWLSGFIDWALFTGVFALVSWLVRMIVEAVSDLESDNWNDYIFRYIVPSIYLILFISWQLLCIACLGKTVGMGIIGLLLVSKGGHRVGICQALIRILLTPLNTLFFGWIVGVIRRDGRQIHDLLACCYMVYSWEGPLSFKKGRRDIDFDGMSVASDLLLSDDELDYNSENQKADEFFSASEILVDAEKGEGEERTGKKNE